MVRVVREVSRPLVPLKRHEVRAPNASPPPPKTAAVNRQPVNRGDASSELARPRRQCDGIPQITSLMNASPSCERSGNALPQFENSP